jgi:hypothetical protein
MPEWNELVASLPENVRQDPALTDIKDLSGLASNFISLKKSAGDWSSGLPDDIRKDPSLEPLKGKGITDVVKSFINAQRLVGADKIVLPKENSKKEEWDDFFKKLGRPDKPEGYKLTKPSDLPKGFPYQEEMMKGFAKVAHETGLSEKQVSSLCKWYLQSEVDSWDGMARDSAQAMQEAESVLRKEYGNAYDQRIGAAKVLIEKFGGPELKAVLDGTGIGNNPLLVKFLVNVAGQFSEDTLKGMGKSQFNIQTPEEAKRQIDELKLNKDFMEAYWNPKNQGHQAAKDKYGTLYAAAYPEQEKK